MGNYVDKKGNLPDCDIFTFLLSTCFDFLIDSSCGDWDSVNHGLLAPLRCAAQPRSLSLHLYEYQAKGLAW